MKTEKEIKKLYKNRFNEKEIKQKNIIWKVLCDLFFQKYIKKDSTVLDIGAGYCEFINNIKCNKKYALDLNEDIFCFANRDVKVFIGKSTNLSFLADKSVDLVFMSNFLEHLKTKEEIKKSLTEIRRVLKIEGGGNDLTTQY